MPLLDLTVDLELDGPQQGWTDVTRDVLMRGGVSWDYGLPGPMPADRAAEIGECRYQLDNSPANSAGITGSYAPGHPDARPGFELGIACRISLAHGGTVRRKLYYLDRVDPSFGPEAARVTVCHGTDWMGIAARTPIREVPLQRAQRTDQIIQTLLDAMPVTPRTVVLGTGQSTLDYALDDLRGDQATALEALYRVTLSEFGYLTADGDDADGETLRFANRAYRPSRTMGHQITRALGAVFQRAVDDIVDVVRVGIPLRRVDTEATTVLYQLGDATPEIPPGATIHPFGPYRDPANEAQRVGGTDMQTPVAGTDYAANTAADGSGTDVTDDMAVAASFGASGVRWTIQNPTAENGLPHAAPGARAGHLRLRAGVPGSRHGGGGSEPQRPDVECALSARHERRAKRRRQPAVDLRDAAHAHAVGDADGLTHGRDGGAGRRRRDPRPVQRRRRTRWGVDGASYQSARLPRGEP